MEYISGNIFIRENRLTPGQVIGGHLHHFDHTSFVPTGRVRVRAWRPKRDLDGKLLHDEYMRLQKGEFLVDREFGEGSQFGRHFLVKADVIHEITNVGASDAEVFCIYAHRTPQGDISQIHTGWYTAYTGGDQVLETASDEEVRKAYGAAA